MNQPEPQGMAFQNLMSDIERGLVKIPQFQRDFVWTKEKAARLLDSILKNYPIGTFIVWKTRETLRSIRNLGDVKLPDTPEGDFVSYVLDGQQRLTSLYASVHGLKIQREDRVDDFRDMYVDLKANETDDVVVADPPGVTSGASIRITELLTSDFKKLASYPDKYHEKLKAYRERLGSYQFPVVVVREAPLDVATEVFTRINVSGQPLSVYEIMVAKTFDAGRRNFDLAEEYETLLEMLREVSYNSISPTVLLQTVAIILSRECSKRAILNLEKRKFIETWPKVVNAFMETVEYLRGYYRIPVSQLLPYHALLVPFSYFFYRKQDRPSSTQDRLLSDFFWRAALGSRYSHALESRLSTDIGRIEKILSNEQPQYDWGIDTSANFIRENGWFSTGRGYIKALLCVLAYQEPKSFDKNAPVRISNDWLKQTNSRNYHHFFPRSYLKGCGIEGRLSNHIANITIVDDYLNKRRIRDRAPSDYLKEFATENEQLRQTLRGHLVDLDAYGIWSNDYTTYVSKRCEAFSKELKERIIPQAIDTGGQQVLTDDYDTLAAETEDF